MRSEREEEERRARGGERTLCAATARRLHPCRKRLVLLPSVIVISYRNHVKQSGGAHAQSSPSPSAENWSAPPFERRNALQGVQAASERMSPCRLLDSRSLGADKRVLGGESTSVERRASRLLLLHPPRCALCSTTVPSARTAVQVGVHALDHAPLATPCCTAKGKGEALMSWPRTRSASKGRRRARYEAQVPGDGRKMYFSKRHAT